MKNVLQFVESFFSSLSSFAKANPALAAMLVGVACTVLARFGFHVSANQLAADVSVLMVILGGLVHVSTKAAAGQHEKP